MKDITLYKYSKFDVADCSINNLDSGIFAGPDEIAKSRMTYVYNGVLDIVQAFDQIGSNSPSSSFSTGTLALPNQIYGSNLSSAYGYTREFLSEWLCFSSPFQFTGNLFNISATHTVPANNGIYVLDGSITLNDSGNTSIASRFIFIKPRNHDVTVGGNANVIFMNFI